MSNTVKVWDPFVRIFHWSLVVAFSIAYLTEDDFQSLHTLAGYTVAGLVGMRLVWGFIGTRRARFSDFVYSPQRVIEHLKEVVKLRPRHYLGHNPAGGLMILLLLFSLVATTFLGMATLAVEEQSGPLAFWLAGVGEFWEEAFEELHEFFANFTLLLVVVHIGGVLVESLLQGENLVRSMVTGRKLLRDNVEK